MALGSTCRHARVVLALAFGAALLAGCGNDEDPAPPGSSSSSATDATNDATNDAATAEPTEEPSTGETTPVVEPASGLKLKLNYAEITMPEGWTREDNHGVPFVRQGTDDGFFGTLTMSELNGGGTDKGATSLDAIAKRELRLVDEPGIKRLEDVVIGGDTMAYRLAGRANKYAYQEVYGALIGNIEYTMLFSFNVRHGSVEEAVATIESMLATWDFNP